MSGLIDQVEMQYARGEMLDNHLHVNTITYTNIKSKGEKMTG